MTKRQIESEEFGTWFAKNGTAKYFVPRLENLVANYKKWLANAEKLLSEKKRELYNVRNEEIRQYLSTCTPEEIAAYQSGN